MPEDYRNKPWMAPIRYTGEQGRDAPQERTQADVDSLIGRAGSAQDSREGGRPAEYKDAEPLDYSNRGNREGDLDLDDREYDSEHLEYVPAQKKAPTSVPLEEVGKLDQNLYETEHELLKTKTAFNELRKEYLEMKHAYKKVCADQLNAVSIQAGIGTPDTQTPEEIADTEPFKPVRRAPGELETKLVLKLHVANQEIATLREVVGRLATLLSTKN